MEDLELQARLFNELKRFSRNSLLKNLYSEGLMLDYGEAQVYLTVDVNYGEDSIEDIRDPFLDISIIDPCAGPYNTIYELILEFNIEFTEIVNYKENNFVENVSITSSDAYRGLKTHFELSAHHLLEDFYRDILLRNVEML